MDLLKLHVPTLFFKEENDLENPCSLRSQFYDFLEKYYRRVQKQCSISDNMGPILVSAICKNDPARQSSKIFKKSVDSLCL